MPAALPRSRVVVSAKPRSWNSRAAVLRMIWRGPPWSLLVGALLAIDDAPAVIPVSLSTVTVQLRPRRPRWPAEVQRLAERAVGRLRSAGDQPPQRGRNVRKSSHGGEEASA